MVEVDDDDTTPTEEGGLLDQLRSDGILGPFRVVDWSGGSDIGAVRPRNEDAWDVTGDELFVVADGIGGHEGGAVAARAAVEVFTAAGRGLSEATAGELASLANAAVVRAGEHAGLRQLGTTVVALAAHRHHVVVMNAGDSRAYRFRDGEIEQITRDHTVRTELEASGIPPELATERNVRLDALTSYLGRIGGDPLAIHAASYSVMAGDRFLLCTDGVHGQLSPGEIVAALGADRCEQAVVRLLRDANERGGRDNATAIVVDFGFDPSIDVGSGEAVAT